MIIEKKKRTYLPENLEIKWDNLQPIFQELLLRDIKSEEELEK